MKTKQISLRITEEQHEAYATAAARQEMEFVDWARTSLDRASRVRSDAENMTKVLRLLMGSSRMLRRLVYLSAAALVCSAGCLILLILR